MKTKKNSGYHERLHKKRPYRKKRKNRPYRRCARSIEAPKKIVEEKESPSFVEGSSKSISQQEGQF